MLTEAGPFPPVPQTVRAGSCSVLSLLPSPTAPNAGYETTEARRKLTIDLKLKSHFREKKVV